MDAPALSETHQVTPPLSYFLIERTPSVLGNIGLIVSNVETFFGHIEKFAASDVAFAHVRQLLSTQLRQLPVDQWPRDVITELKKVILVYMKDVQAMIALGVDPTHMNTVYVYRQLFCLSLNVAFSIVSNKNLRREIGRLTTESLQLGPDTPAFKTTLMNFIMSFWSHCALLTTNESDQTEYLRCMHLFIIQCSLPMNTTVRDLCFNMNTLVALRSFLTYGHTHDICSKLDSIHHMTSNACSQFFASPPTVSSMVACTLSLLIYRDTILSHQTSNRTTTKGDQILPFHQKYLQQTLHAFLSVMHRCDFQHPLYFQCRFELSYAAEESLTSIPSDMAYIQRMRTCAPAADAASMTQAAYMMPMALTLVTAEYQHRLQHSVVRLPLSSLRDMMMRVEQAVLGWPIPTTLWLTSCVWNGVHAGYEVYLARMMQLFAVRAVRWIQTLQAHEARESISAGQLPYGNKPVLQEWLAQADDSIRQLMSSPAPESAWAKSERMLADIAKLSCFGPAASAESLLSTPSTI